MWNLQNFCIIRELFREINFTVNLFTRKVVLTEIFQKTLIQKFRNFYTVHIAWCGKIKIFSLEIFSSYQLPTYLAISLVKLLFSRNFSKKSVRVNFWKYHTMRVLWYIALVLLLGFSSCIDFTKISSTFI